MNRFESRLRTETQDQWIREAIRLIDADANRSADTHLLSVSFKAFPEIAVYLKDESTLPSGSLKHRLARSLFLYHICNGRIHEGTTIIDASSGSTAISEAYFARLLSLPFIAVVPHTTAVEKIRAIENLGGRCDKVEGCRVYERAQALAEEVNGCYMDQFTYAERATDWRGNNNIAESLFRQIHQERHPVPSWIVVGAGTGGTAATIGRYLRYKADPLITTRLCVADPDYSVFFDAYRLGDRSLVSTESSRIEGIGRPRVEPSFLPEVIDSMIKVPDAASIATIWWLEKLMGRRFGPSTGTNVFALLQLMEGMRSRGETGSVVTLICDSGERYGQTYYNEGWLKEKALDISGAMRWLEDLEC